MNSNEFFASLNHFGLVIDDSGTPSLYLSVEEAKSAVVAEMAKFFGSKYWSDYNCYVVWSYPIDANYETPTAYLGNDNWLSDDFADFTVWDVAL